MEGGGSEASRVQDLPDGAAGAAVGDAVVQDGLEVALEDPMQLGGAGSTAVSQREASKASMRRGRVSPSPSAVVTRKVSTGTAVASAAIGQAETVTGSPSVHTWTRVYCIPRAPTSTASTGARLTDKHWRLLPLITHWPRSATGGIPASPRWNAPTHAAAVCTTLHSSHHLRCHRRSHPRCHHDHLRRKVGSGTRLTPLEWSGDQLACRPKSGHPLLHPRTQRPAIRVTAARLSEVGTPVSHHRARLSEQL